MSQDQGKNSNSNNISQGVNMKNYQQMQNSGQENHIRAFLKEHKKWDSEVKSRNKTCKESAKKLSMALGKFREKR